jgi:pseudaminic acid synthase
MSSKSVYIIAELSANHGGALSNAIKTIKEAKSSGANAIKLQTYTADTITLNSKKDYFKISEGTMWDGRFLWDLYHEAHTPWEWHEEIFRVAREEGLECFSSPFDFTAVDFLEQFNPPYYKIASFEINDLPLISYTASKGRPMIMSTGMGNEEDIQNALDACYKVGNTKVTLLKCTSSYPAPVSAANMNSIPLLREVFKVPVGLSDHTEGFIVPVTAVALGAEIVEKHFILDRKLGGPDASFSMEPQEFKYMVDRVRDVELALGEATFDIPAASVKNLKFRRSLFVTKDINQGELFTANNVRSVRPSDGLAPEMYLSILGKKANKNLIAGQPLKLIDIE